MAFGWKRYIIIYICNYLAKPYIQNFKDGGYYSCSYCTIMGEYSTISDSIIFPPNLPFEERTDEKLNKGDYALATRAEMYETPVIMINIYH
jgi:hypothetical protein